MHSGDQSSRSRAIGPAAIVSNRDDGEPLKELSSRYVRLLKRVRILAQHCEQTPDGLRQQLKQFLDLAVIELEEGYQALVRYQGNVPLSAGNDGPVRNELCPRQKGTNLQVETEQEIVVPNRRAVADSHQCEQRIDSALEKIELSFDAMAKLAEIPEAADLTAILARLEIDDDAHDADDFEKPVKTSPTNTRERLLGFEVCRMEARPKPADFLPELPPETQPEEQLGAVPGPAELSQVAPLSEPDVIGNDLTGSGLLPIDPNEPNQEPSAACLFAFCSAESAGSESVDSAANPAAEPNPPSVDAQPQQMHASNVPKMRPSEQVENVNPLDSIGADNLQAILALKAELEQVSAKFRNSGAS